MQKKELTWLASFAPNFLGRLTFLAGFKPNVWLQQWQLRVSPCIYQFERHWSSASATAFFLLSVRRISNYNSRKLRTTPAFVGSIVPACLVVSDSLRPFGLCPWGFPGKNTRVGCHFLLQGIFPTQGSNLHLLYLLHCRQILYPLSHRGSPCWFWISPKILCYSTFIVLQPGSMGRQGKAGTSRLTGNHTFWVIIFLEAEKKGEERWDPLESWVHPVAHYALIVVNLALQLRSTGQALRPWYFWSKLNEDGNLPSPWDDGAGMKIRECKPPSPPSPGNIPPLHLYTSHNRPAREAWSSCSSPLLSPRPLTAYPCLNQFSLYFLNLPACLRIFLHRDKNLKFTGNNSFLSWTSVSCIIKPVC